MFTNLRLFDGTGAPLRSDVHVLVEADRIAAVGAGTDPPPASGRTIDCGGRVLMPGLIDAHWHAMLAATPLPTLMTADVGYLYLAASAEAERTLMRGFTTIRDLGGPSFALKTAIDEGLVPGPRIFPSGAVITQTGGHGDFRMLYEVPRAGATPTRTEALGAAAIADGPDEVRRCAREQLMAGASQIKLTAGGGVASPHSPLDATLFRPEEIRAAVDAAADWGTYVTAHAYMPEGITRCVEAGVKCIEHGHLGDDEAARVMADRGIWWNLQPFTEEFHANVLPDPDRQAKLRMVQEGTDMAYGLAIKHGVKVGWGTDILFDPTGTAQQGRMLAAMTRWYTPAQALKAATSGNAELLALSGPRNPYPGRLGVIQKGALADILVVDGDPT
ncbi:MAG TPA: amidohydrolase family protein, partial [Thermodesulfobacteriota bacterium]